MVMKDDAMVATRKKNFYFIQRAPSKKIVIYFFRARPCVGRDVCATSISRAYAGRSDTSRMAMKKKAAKKSTSKKKTTAKKSAAKKPAAKKKTAAKRKR
jgi:hypothetical protein